MLTVAPSGPLTSPGGRAPCTDEALSSRSKAQGYRQSRVLRSTLGHLSWNVMGQDSAKALPPRTLAVATLDELEFDLLDGKPCGKLPNPILGILGQDAPDNSVSFG